MSAPATGGGPAKGSAVSPARAAAFAALRRLRRGNAHLDDSAAALPELSSLSVADRGLANELINGTVKRRGSIDAVLGMYTKAPLKSTDPDVRDALRLAAFQLLFLDRVPAYAVVDDAVTLATRKSKRAGGFVNAVLRRVAIDGRARLAELGEGDEARSWAAGLSYPLWLVKRVRADIGPEAARRLLEAGNAAPERCLRANRLRGGLPAARRAMAAEGFKTRGVDGLPDALLYEGPPLERSGRLPGRARDAAVARLADRRDRRRGRCGRAGRTGAGPVRGARRQDQPAGGAAARGEGSPPSRWTRRARASFAPTSRASARTA